MNEIADLKQQLAETQEALAHCQAALAATTPAEDSQVHNAQNEAIFRLLADNANDLITLSNERGDISYVSPSAVRISGYTIEELMDLGSIWPLIHPDDKDLVIDRRAQVKNGLKTVEEPLVIRVFRKDKAIRWLETTTRYIADPDDPKKKVILGTSHDITDYVKNQRELENSSAELELQAKALAAAKLETEQANAELERSSRLYRLLADNATIVVALRPQNDDKYFYVSPSSEATMGYTPEEMMDFGGFAAFVVPEDAHVIEEMRDDLIAGGGKRTKAYRLRYIRKNGDIAWARTSVEMVPSVDRPGEFDVLATLFDITDFVESQLALEKSQAEVERGARLFKVLADATQDMVAVRGLTDDHYHYVSPSIERFTGYAAEEIQAAGTFDLFLAPEEQPKVEALKKELATSGTGRTEPALLRFVRKDGEVRWGQGTLALVPAVDDPEKFDVLAAMHDVTDFIETQQALEASQAEVERSSRMFRILADNTTDMVALRPAKGGSYYYISPAAAKMTGYTLDEMYEAGEFSVLMVEEDLPKLQALGQALMESGGKPQDPILLRYRRKDGSVRWGKGTLALVPGVEDPSEFDIFASLHDVTDLVQVQEELESSQAELERSSKLFETLATHSTDIVNLRTMEGEYFYHSPSVERLLGYTVEEMLEMGDVAQHVHPDDIPVIKERRERYAKGESQFSEPVIVRFVRKDGDIIWVKLTTSFVPDLEDPTKTNILASAHDMTDVIQNQQELEKLSEELERNSRLFRVLADNSADGVALRTLEGEFKYVSPSVTRMSGYSIEHVMEKGMWAIIHPDDMPRAMEYAKKSLNPKPGEAFEPFIHRYVRKDGVEGWCETLFSLVPDPFNPGEMNVLLTIHDMTEIYEVQQELQNSKDELERSSRIYRILADNSSDFIALLGSKGTYSYISPSSGKLLGYEPDELRGRTSLWELIHPDDQAQMAAFRQILGEGKRPNLAPTLIRVVKKEGDVRWHEIAFSYVPSLDGGDNDDILIATHDVNEIVENQQAAEVARKELETQTKIMTQDVELARTMQMAILPHDFPAHPHYEVDAFMQAARMVGGDFYDYFELDDYRVGLVMADVSGKGVPAAFFMSMSRAVMETEARTGRAPSEVLTIVNQHLRAHNPIDLFVTMFYGILDLRTGTLVYSNGGHNSPYIVRENGTVEKLEPTRDMSLGAMEDSTYIEKEAGLTTGDTLFLFTDGFTEAFNADNAMFAESRLETSLAAAFDKPVNALLNSVVNDVRAFVGNHEQSDDLTCMALRLTSLIASKERRHVFRDLAEPIQSDAQVSIELTSSTDRVYAMQNQFEEFCSRWDVPTEFVYKTNVCLEEYVVNLISHGFNNEDGHAIRLKVIRANDGLYIAIEDHGEPFNPLLAPEPDLEASATDRQDGGLGIHIIRTYMDELTYETRKGINRFGLVKYISKT